MTGDTEEVARARLERAGFGMRVAATYPTSDPDKDGVVLAQNAGSRMLGRVWARPGLTVGSRSTVTRPLARPAPDRSQAAEAIVHVKRVRLSSGASPPGRTPPRTSNTGDGERVATASRSASRPC